MLSDSCRSRWLERLLTSKKRNLLLVIVFVAVGFHAWKRNGNAARNGTISIAIITCGDQNRLHLKRKPESIIERPLTLIKSIFLSSKLSKVDHLELHIFTDSQNITDTLNANITRFQAIMKDHLQVSVYYYSVYRSVPQSAQYLIPLPIGKPCGYVRLFLPDYLPRKEILYLDTDTIITGNIRNIWKNFFEKVATDGSSNATVPLVGIAPNDLKNTRYIGTFRVLFTNIPYVPPRGVNSGVMFMNLEAMRKYNWTELVMKTVDEYRSRLTDDQRIVNIIFHNHPSKLVIFPCTYNFIHVMCDRGLVCNDSATDEDGIRIVHASAGTYRKGAVFYRIYEDFKSFNLEHYEKAVQQLYKPLIQFYSDRNPDTFSGRSNCFGLVGEDLFKSLL